MFRLSHKLSRHTSDLSNVRMALQIVFRYGYIEFSWPDNTQVYFRCRMISRHQNGASWDHSTFETLVGMIKYEWRPCLWVELHAEQKQYPAFLLWDVVNYSWLKISFTWYCGVNLLIIGPVKFILQQHYETEVALGIQIGTKTVVAKCQRESRYRCYVGIQLSFNCISRTLDVSLFSFLILVQINAQNVYIYIYLSESYGITFSNIFHLILGHISIIIQIYFCTHPWTRVCAWVSDFIRWQWNLDNHGIHRLLENAPYRLPVEHE